MLVQYGGGVLDARGSIGGQTASRNRFGNYLRARTTPVNPNSSRQNLIRSVIQSLSTRWSTVLTQLQRDGWEVYALNITRVNKLGQQILLTGFNHYIRSNSVRLQSVDTIIDEPPTTLTLPPGDPAMIGTVSTATQLISVAFDDTFDWLNQDQGRMFVFMSQPKSAGVTFVGGPFRLAGSIIGNSTTPPTTPETIAVPFTVSTGQIVVVRARIGEEDGRLSDLFRSQSSVAA